MRVVAGLFHAGWSKNYIENTVYAVLWVHVGRISLRVNVLNCSMCHRKEAEMDTKITVRHFFLLIRHCYISVILLPQ